MTFSCVRPSKIPAKKEANKRLAQQHMIKRKKIEIKPGKPKTKKKSGNADTGMRKRGNWKHIVRQQRTCRFMTKAPSLVIYSFSSLLTALQNKLKHIVLTDCRHGNALFTFNAIK